MAVTALSSLSRPKLIYIIYINKLKRKRKKSIRQYKGGYYSHALESDHTERSNRKAVITRPFRGCFQAFLAFTSG
jgi:hypothetical protein